jgi:type I site-specific restriction endonuclease
VPNTVAAQTRGELQDLLARDSRKVIITTIHKFGEADGVLNPRDNIIVLVDEAHRTQEGDLGRKMRDALPNAFLFGLTGTPINTRDRNTFYAFGSTEDSGGYIVMKPHFPCDSKHVQSTSVSTVQPSMKSSRSSSRTSQKKTKPRCRSEPVDLRF